MISQSNTTIIDNGKKRRAFADVTNSLQNLPVQGNKAKENLGIKKVKTNKATAVVIHPPSIVVPSRAQTEPSTQAPVAKSFQIHSAVTSNNVQNASSYQYTGKVDNIDDRDRDDPLCATEYVADMYTRFRDQEKTTSVRPFYMLRQPQIDTNMRAILIDWLVTVHAQFKLVPETLYLAVNILDRYLERKDVPRSKLQLVGITSLFIASKYEEIYAPVVRDMVYICDGIYRRQEIVQCENNILSTLEFKITVPTAHTFLVRYLKAAHADKNMAQMACYILEGTLQSYELLQYLPSQLASAAVLIARMSSGRNEWSPTLLKYTEYTEEIISPVANNVLKEKASASSDLKATYHKYSSRRFGSVAKIPLW